MTKEDLPDGKAWAFERIQLKTHNGTHLDAPYHFHPTMNRGERAITIDEVPLDWCFQRGVTLDFRHLPNGYVVTAAEVEAELQRIGHALQLLDIVVINTALPLAGPGRSRFSTNRVPMDLTLMLQGQVHISSLHVNRKPDYTLTYLEHQNVCRIPTVSSVGS